MNHQIYRTVKAGEKLEQGDVYPDNLAKQLLPISGLIYNKKHDGECCVLRPVSINRVTGTESAFPAFDGSGAVGGMTLREHYAGLALQGFMGIPDNRTWKGDTQDGPVEAWQHKLMAMDAELCVKMADALIAALNKKEEGV